jgi:hypothetical protein
LSWLIIWDCGSEPAVVVGAVVVVVTTPAVVVVVVVVVGVPEPVVKQEAVPEAEHMEVWEEAEKLP